MAIVDTLLNEFDHEMDNTRKMLERIPEGKLGWKPHAKSMPMGRLADHIAEIPMWGINKSLNVIVSAAIVSYFAIRNIK